MNAVRMRTYERSPQFDVRIEEDPAIDLVHLARQTDGDQALESELLAMFDAQAAKLIQRIGLPEVSAQAKSDIAHRLKGSALGIGAPKVAAAADIAERHYAALSAGGAVSGDPLIELGKAVREARDAIARLGL